MVARRCATGRTKPSREPARLQAPATGPENSWPRFLREENPMSIETNRQIIENLLDLIERRQVREAFERYVAEDYVQHNPTAENGRENAIALLEKFVSAPGFRHSIKRIIVDGDLAVTHMHLQLEKDDPGFAV